MALFQEKQTKQGWCENRKLEDLTPANGTSIGYYLVETPMIDGDDGQFMVCNGLLVNLGAKTIEDLVNTAEAVSFIPKSILEGDITEGQWEIGQLARLENSNRPGDKNKQGKKTRYYAWNVFIQDIPASLKADLDKKVKLLQGKDSELNLAETPAASSNEKPAL